MAARILQARIQLRVECVSISFLAGMRGDTGRPRRGEYCCKSRRIWTAVHLSQSQYDLEDCTISLQSWTHSAAIPCIVASGEAENQ